MVRLAWGRLCRRQGLMTGAASAASGGSLSVDAAALHFRQQWRVASSTRLLFNGKKCSVLFDAVQFLRRYCAAMALTAGMHCMGAGIHVATSNSKGGTRCMQERH